MAAPKTPKGLTLTVETITKNTKAINGKIFHNEDLSHLSHYDIYAKRTPFTEDPLVLPDQAHLVATASPFAGTFRYIPAYDYLWYFRVFAKSSLGESSDFVSSFTNVGDVNPVLDFTIDSFSVKNSFSESEAEGKVITSYIDTEPEFRWISNFIFQESPEIINNLLGNFGYRLTFRGKSLNDKAPSREVFFSVTGYKETNFTLNLLSNISGFGGSYSDRNFPEFARREFDVVVEAHDDEGFSSAGGNFITGDSFVNYSSEQGFKLLSLQNKAIPSQVISGENSYITIDNFIKFVNLPINDSDVLGYYVFASTGSFEPKDIVGKSEQEIRDKQIDILEVKPNSTTIEIKPNIQDLKLADTAYVAVSYFDKFDKGLFDFSNQNVSRMTSSPDAEYFGPAFLNISNVIQINKNSNEIKKSIAEGFKVWIRINENGEWMGNGIKAVKTIDLESSEIPESYKNYKGFVPYSCYSRDIGGFTDFYCGYKYDPNKLRGGSRTDVKKGFKRYRVYFEDNFIQPDANYAVIGLNASNAPYPKVDELFDSLGIDTLNSIGLLEAFDLYKEGSSPNDIYFGDGPAFYKHHPAGFGQGFGGLEKEKSYFDVHMGHLIDMSYLREGFFAIVTNTDGNFLAKAEEWD